VSARLDASLYLEEEAGLPKHSTLLRMKISPKKEDFTPHEF